MRVPSVPRCPDSNRTTAVVRSALLLQPVPVTHYSLVMARLTDKTGLARRATLFHTRTYMSVCKVFVVVACPPVDNSNWRKFFYFRCVGNFLQLDFYHSFLELFVRFLLQLLQQHFAFWNFKSGLWIEQAGLRPRCCFIIIFNPQFRKFAYLQIYSNAFLAGLPKTFEHFSYLSKYTGVSLFTNVPT